MRLALLLNTIIMRYTPQRKLIQIIPAAVWSMLVAVLLLLPLPVIIKMIVTETIEASTRITKTVFGLIMNTMGMVTVMCTFTQTAVNISLISRDIF